MLGFKSDNILSSLWKAIGFYSNHGDQIMMLLLKSFHNLVLSLNILFHISCFTPSSQEPWEVDREETVVSALRMVIMSLGEFK